MIVILKNLHFFNENVSLVILFLITNYFADVFRCCRTRTRKIYAGDGSL